MMRWPGVLFAGLVGLLACLPRVLEACSRWDVRYEAGWEFERLEALSQRSYAAAVERADEDADQRLNATELQRFASSLCAWARRPGAEGFGRDLRFEKILTKRLARAPDIDVAVLFLGLVHLAHELLDLSYLGHDDNNLHLGT